MSNNKYPAEIYDGWRMKAVLDSLERAYDLGKKHAQVDTGDWHNLTKAIADGEPIDFEKLNGRKMRMMHEDGRDIRGYKMCIRYQGKLDEIVGWFTDKCISGHRPVEFELAWAGRRGWTLWLDGEIPMKKQTAEQLPFGTSFKDSHGYEYVVVARNKVQALYGNHNVTPAENIIVAEVLGMYGQKESE